MNVEFRVDVRPHQIQAVQRPGDDEVGPALLWCSCGLVLQLPAADRHQIAGIMLRHGTARTN